MGEQMPISFPDMRQAEFKKANIQKITMMMYCRIIDNYYLKTVFIKKTELSY